MVNREKEPSGAGADQSWHAPVLRLIYKAPPRRPRAACRQGDTKEQSRTTRFKEASTWFSGGICQGKGQGIAPGAIEVA